MESVSVSSGHLMGVVSSALLLFGIAGLVVPLLQRLKISPVFGYLLCGIVIGPHGLAALPGIYEWVGFLTIKDTETIHTLGEFGIVSLMFMIGLELSFGRLRELRRFIFGLGSIQIVATAAVVFMVAQLFGNSVGASVLLGAAFALSSTAIVMKLLEDRHLASRPVGVLSFSILLMQDLAVVPILVFASSFTGGEGQSILQSIIASLAIGGATVLAIFVVGQRVIKVLFSQVSTSRSAEWLAAFTVFVVMACAALTHSAGMSFALGAFLAGLLIAETEFCHEVDVIVAPIKGMLLGIFFLSIGMVIDVGEIFTRPLLLLVSIFGIYLLKTAVLFPLCLLFKIPARDAFKTSIYLSQPGEFALLLLGVALASKLIPAQDGQFFYLLTASAMMLSPVLFRIEPFLSSRLFPDREQNSRQDEFPQGDERVVLIAGFGRVGQLLADALEAQHIAYIAFDHDAVRVSALRKEGYRVVYGDARKIELWQSLNHGHAIMVVIAIDTHDVIHSIIKSIRTKWPLLPIIARSKDTSDMKAYYDLGADHVVAETLESSLRMANLVMIQAGSEESDAERVIEKLRRKNELF